MCGTAFEKKPTKSALCQVWLKSGQWFWRLKILKTVHLFSLYVAIIPLWKGCSILLNKNESTLPYSDSLTHAVILEKKSLHIVNVIYFHYFTIISPSKRTNITQLEFPSPK